MSMLQKPISYGPIATSNYVDGNYIAIKQVTAFRFVWLTKDEFMNWNPQSSKVSNAHLV